MEIIRGKRPGAKKVVVYGPEGIGKSTFAVQFPETVFIDTEGGTKDMDVARTPSPTSWTMLMEQVEYVRAHVDICKTLVVDTIDWAEQMCVEHICARHQKDGLESFGYGTGYVYAKEECRNCFAKFYCSGGCAANAYNMHGDINKTYEVGCELQKKRIECAIMIQAAKS